LRYLIVSTSDIMPPGVVTGGNVMRSFCVVALIASGALAGCAASGVQVSEQQAQSFQVGKSTYSDVVSQLGEPTTSTVDSKGARIAVYNYSAVQSRPQNFIPYIGPFVSGYDTKSSAVSFTFDKRNILTDTTSTQNNMGMGTNLAAGSSQPAPNAAQPR
jgi:hypothetical protein